MEIIISICIFAASIIAVLTLLTALFKTSQKSVDVAVGTAVAAACLDRYIYTTSFQDIETGIEGSSGAPIFHRVEKLKSGEFTCDIKGSRVEPGQVVRLDISVSWWQDEGKKGGRSEYGLLTRELTRFVTRRR